MASTLVDFFYSMGGCLKCLPFASQPMLKINKRTLKIRRLLGEGGFSYVYLVEDTATFELFALKKIRCPFGQESVSLAMKEVEAYGLFRTSPNIIRSLDHSVVADKDDAQAKTVYVLLPYFRRGNLQDLINANLVNQATFPEKRLMSLFLGVCHGLKAMHDYRIWNTPIKEKSKRDGKKKALPTAEDRDAAQASGHKDDEEAAQPLMEDPREEIIRSQEGLAPGTIRAYAHRDIKPGNIMISDDGTQPVLMDFGSLVPSPTKITSRSQALAVQDQAAEQCTLPYRAPELFDVKTGSLIDTKVDIWSLGCTLYACVVGKSPFEARSDETGGSLSMCILGNDWRFPDEEPGKGKQKATPPTEGGITPCVKDVVRRCLKLEPEERPDVDELIGIITDVMKELPNDPPDE